METKITFPPEFANFSSKLGDLWVSEAKTMDKYMKGLTENDTVLDLACGVGFSTNYIANKFGCKVLGVDILTDMVATARKRYDGDNVEFMVGDMCDPNLLVDRWGTFTWVMGSYGLHHVTDAESFLENCYKLTKDNGYFLNLCLTREFDVPEITQALEMTLRDPKWKPYSKEILAANLTPLYSLTPEKHPWILDTKVLFHLIERHGFRILDKEIRHQDHRFPLDKVLLKAVLIAVKALPEHRQDEFLDDLVTAGTAIIGDPQPITKYSTVITCAQKVEKP